MATLPTADEVKTSARPVVRDILPPLDVTVYTDTVVDRFISSSYIRVSSALGESLKIDELTLAVFNDLCAWVAAHLLTVTRERQPVSAKADEAEIKYPDEFDQGLRSTTYGQYALELDPTGLLAATAETGQTEVFFKAVRGV